MKRLRTPLHGTTIVALVLGLMFGGSDAQAERELLNASFDVSREFYAEYNAAFIRSWQSTSGEAVKVNQSHGGSSKQARAVIDGLEADVVTMNQQTDIDQIAAAGLLPKDWRSRLPDNSAPYSSTIVFLVRKGNPKGIRDWGDLIRPGVQPIIPNPKTSGNGRYSYLAAWAYALRNQGGEAEAFDFVRRLFTAVPVLDSGGRGATTTFVQRGIGDVLLTFENEVYLIAKELSPNDFEVVTPSISIEAEAPVAVVEKIADKHGTLDLARAYLQYQWSEEGQRIAASHYLRPRNAAAAAAAGVQFPAIEQIGIEAIGADWNVVQKKHFADGGLFDRIFQE